MGVVFVTGIEIFNRLAVHTSNKMYFGAFKLAKLANAQFENLSLGKLAGLYGALEKWENVELTPRPM